MATDQPTDARLRYRVLCEMIILEVNAREAKDGHPSLFGKAGEHIAFDAALDTLIQYHREAGAVEALEAVGCRWVRDDEEASCANYNARFPKMPRPLCTNCKALAEAQARLAAYEEERGT